MYIFVPNRMLQEAQDIFGVDFDFDEFEQYGGEDYDEEEELEEEVSSLRYSFMDYFLTREHTSPYMLIECLELFTMIIYKGCCRVKNSTYNISLFLFQKLLKKLSKHGC